ATVGGGQDAPSDLAMHWAWATADRGIGAITHGVGVALMVGG
ncbi:MAG: hypothetical protein RL254_1365, partial [Planctomycetota bacterium]